jgi:hypothetical protein
MVIYCTKNLIYPPCNGNEIRFALPTGSPVPKYSPTFKKKLKQDMVIHTYNPSTQKVRQEYLEFKV